MAKIASRARLLQPRLLPARLLPALSIRQRISYGFLVMTVMVVIAGIIGVAFTWSAERANIAVRAGMQAQNQVNAISSAWLASADMLSAPADDGVSASVGQTVSLSPFRANFAVLEQELSQMRLQPPGSSVAARQQNSAILELTARTAADLKITSEEILLAREPLAAQSEERSAAREMRDASLRDTRLQTLQRSLNQSLDLLRQNIQADVDLAFANAQRMRSLARLAWSGLAVLGALLGTVFSIFFTRTIVRSIQELTLVVQRVTSRDFSPLEPNPRQDELGELWSSLGLLTDWLRGNSAPSSVELQRTRELERRSTQMQVAAEVARDASSVRSLDALLSNAVELIRGRFGFYHAGIYLNDEHGEYTVLQAATGEAGRQLLAQGYRLQVGEVGIVGYVANAGKPRIAKDVGDDTAIAGAVRTEYTPHSLGSAYPAGSAYSALPATRSEMALPLKIGERVIGVLDVQSQLANAFSQEDVGALQILADQLAVAIENARLINDYQESLRELESVYLRLSRGAWADIKRSRVHTGYAYDINGVKPIENPAPPLPARRSPTAEQTNNPPDLHKVVVPLQVRGSRIGSLEIWLQESQYNPQVEYFLQQLSPRLSQSMESARLYQETQDRATRERLVGDISGRLRETLNVDAVLRTAAEEIRSALGLNDLKIQLGGPAAQNGKNGNAAPFSSAAASPNVHDAPESEA